MGTKTKIKILILALRVTWQWSCRGKKKLELGSQVQKGLEPKLGVHVAMAKLLFMLREAQ